MAADVILAPDADRFPLSSSDHALVERSGYEIRAQVGHDLEAFRADASDAVACLVWGGYYGEDVLGTMPRLRVLARCGVGVDNIDFAAARARGILVTYCPGYLDKAVAEHVLAAILAISRKILASDHAVRDGKWPSFAELGPLHGLSGSTLGLVGFGRIGSAVYRLARAFECDTMIYDPQVPPKQVPPDVRVQSSLHELLGAADYVSLHTPLTARTRGMIGERELSAMRPQAVLVNTARGALVDSDALVDALSRGVIAGAALDVFDPEPIPPGHPILSLRNTVITPHSSAYETGALDALRRQALLDAVAVLQGGRPQFLASDSSGG